jgi:hypothetical protein
MSKCENCGHENDIDASFCESCGANLKTGTFSKKPGEIIKKEESMAQSTKILILVCVVLVIGVGIAAGVLIKSSQQNVQDPAKSSINQISKDTGFPVSQAPALAVEISKYGGSIESVNYGSITLDKNQCLYILSKAIVMINNGQQGNISIKSYESAGNPYGTVTSATINKEDYVDIASRTYTWMDNNGQSPNYVGINNPGQPDLSPVMSLNLFSKVLSVYNSTGQLPASVTIP